MKKRLFCLLLSITLLFTGCSTPSEPVQQTTAASSAPFVLIHTSDGDIEPYRHFRSAHSWEEHGWLAACGSTVYTALPSICDELPTVTYSKAFGISYGENISYYRLDIFNEGLQYTDYTELATLPQGTYYISIEVTKQGDYIAAGKDYERFGYAAVFRLEMP